MAELCRQTVAVFEKVALVVGEGKLDDLQDHDQHDRQHDHRHGFVETARQPLRDRRRQFAQPMAAAAERQSQQHDAGKRRPQEVGTPAQAMVFGGFIFVQDQ